ncbi:YlaI family protein [Alkalicoccus chagannorensis]|uniref:YlaI family protein n=1 Tax=Alkalicoccus chagannorensis TaxID=427072 RepID=UPI00041C91C8|nr:YlaI family protein [Alkalicoccus chagannorensis]
MLRVKCVLCEKIESLNSDTPEAKKLRNRPIHTYMCDSCRERIGKKTEERKAGGQFHMRRPHSEEEKDPYI